VQSRALHKKKTWKNQASERRSYLSVFMEPQKRILHGNHAALQKIFTQIFWLPSRKCSRGHVRQRIPRRLFLHTTKHACFREELSHTNICIFFVTNKPQERRDNTVNHIQLIIEKPFGMLHANITIRDCCPPE